MWSGSQRSGSSYGRGHSGGGGYNSNRRNYDNGGRGRQPPRYENQHRDQRPRFNNAPPAPSDTELDVVTNQNMLFMPNSSKRCDYIQYMVTINNGWYQRVKDEVGEFVKDEVTGRDKREWGSREITGESMEKFAKKPFPWRIMKKLDEMEDFKLAYDGDIKAYSLSANSLPEEGKEYQVKVKRDCEEDDPDADRIKDCWFGVIFHVTRTFSFEEVESVYRGDEGPASEEIRTMLNIALKTNLILSKGMISLDPSSSSVFFPLSEQRQLLSHHRGVSIETRDRSQVMLSGLGMTVINHKGSLRVMLESAVKYANKEYMQVLEADQRHRDSAVRVPLLNLDGRPTIAGVGISNKNQPINDHTKRDIEEAIAKLGKINVAYPFRNTKTGRDELRVYKNKPFRRDDREDSNARGERIITSAEDLIFKTKDGQEHTVASFFDTQYGIKLRYPNMPIIHVDDISRHGGGWFPIELLYQPFGKSKDNRDEHITSILKYHDSISGKRYMDEVENKFRKLSTTGSEGAKFEDRMRDWNMQIETTPVVETAKIHQAPAIKIGGNPAHSNNGSFDLRGVRFSRPAKLASFAVVNFARKESCYKFVKKQLKVAKNHGIEIPSTIMDMTNPNDDRYLDLVSVHYSGRDPVGDALDAFSMAIQKAKKFHLYDSHQVYRKNNMFYHSYCFSDDEVELECMVLPPDDLKGKLGLLLDYKTQDKHYFSHQIVTNSGTEHNVRLMVKVTDTAALIDPLDFRFCDGRHEALRRNGEWRVVRFDQHCYFCPKTETMFQESDIKSKSFKHLADNWEIDFPSIVFAYKPDDSKPLYDRIKVVSNYFGGVQSQCAVMTKFEGQRNQDQYASNIATKINAKLSTIYDKAISWTTTHIGGRGGGDKDMLPWVGDAPTMVLGLGMAHGMGKYAKSVIVASLCLGSGCMRLSHSCYIQRKADKKSDAISKCVFKDIVTQSIDRYANEQGCNPKRLWLQRDGLSDGNFKQADIEIGWIKEAMEDKLGHTVPITFVICQSQQLGFRMAPSKDRFKRNNKPDPNVPSGTIVDCGPNSFYMVAQGGLKGTSKPVKHIVHLNENEQNGLTMLNLKDCTYQMCWKYPTATKAVRELPTIKYAKRLANQVLSSLSCLEAGYNWFGKRIKLVCPEGDTLTDEEKRPFLEILNEQGEPIFPGHRQYNIVDMPFRNHLAA